MDFVNLWTETGKLLSSVSSVYAKISQPAAGGSFTFIIQTQEIFSSNSRRESKIAYLPKCQTTDLSVLNRMVKCNFSSTITQRFPTIFGLWHLKIKLCHLVNLCHRLHICMSCEHFNQRVLYFSNTQIVSFILLFRPIEEKTNPIFKEKKQQLEKNQKEFL